MRTTLKKGDRVYVLDDKEEAGISRGEIRTVLHVDGLGRVQLLRDSMHIFPGHFLRVIEPGETIPKGAVTRDIAIGGLGIEFTYPVAYTSRADGCLRVIVSVPEPEASPRDEALERITRAEQELEAAKALLSKSGAE